MTEPRPAIPAALQRQLFIESGYRCSVPACGVTDPLEIDHIEEWSKVKEHTYENLIVLCANHHGMKSTGGPRKLTTASLRIIKANQVEMNGRYGDIERRVIDHFVRNPEARRVHLPGDFDLLLSRLLEADLLEWDSNTDGTVGLRIPQPRDEGEAASGQGDNPVQSVTDLDVVMRRAYCLTSDGAEYVAAIREARAL